MNVVVYCPSDLVTWRGPMKIGRTVKLPATSIVGERLGTVSEIKPRTAAGMRPSARREAMLGIRVVIDTKERR